MVANGEGGVDDARPVHIRVGIKIKGKAVRLLYRVDPSPPWMKLQGVYLNQSEQALEVLDDGINGVTFALLDSNLPKTARKSLGDVFLIEAILVNATRATDEAQRPVNDVRQDPGRNLNIVFRKATLGQSLSGIEDAIRMGEPHALQNIGGFLPAPRTTRWIDGTMRLLPGLLRISGRSSLSP